MCWEVQREGTLSQKSKPSGQVVELPDQASCTQYVGRDGRDGTDPGKPPSPRGARLGKHMVWGERRMKERRES